MPIFEYICQECQHEFEALVFGKDKAACPKCQSKRLAPQLSVFAVSAKSGAAPSMQAGPCGLGGDPPGTGSGSLADSPFMPSHWQPRTRRRPLPRLSEKPPGEGETSLIK